MRILRELRERNVFRVGAAYAIVAWIVMQLGDILLGNFGAPEWVFRTLVILLALGFPLALILAWAFELTPEGVRRNAEVEPAAAPPPGARRPIDYLIVAGLAVVIGFMVIERVWLDRGPGAVRSARIAGAPEVPDDGVGRPDRRAIAVLPFDNFSPDPNDAYFAAGITEELTSQLSRIGALRVMSRVAVTRALESEASLAGIASELGVGTILEGSVRKDRDRVRVTAQMIDPGTSEHLWSEDYDRDLSDIFELQREVALAIVEALRAELTAGEQAGISAPPTGNVQAYELYLRSGQLLGSFPEQNRRAMDLLRQAVALDPDFAEAWGRLSWRYFWAANHGQETAADSALALARHALELDPELPFAHYALATAYIAAERMNDAEAAMVRAIQLDPSHESALLDGAFLAGTLGNLSEGLERVSAGLVLSPNVPNTRFHVAWNLLALGDHPRLRAWLHLAAEAGMEAARLDATRIALAVMENQADEALELAREGLARWTGNPEFESFAATALLVVGAWDEAGDIIEERAREMPDALFWLPYERSWRTMFAFLLKEAGESERAAALLDESLRSSQAALEAGSDRAGRAVEIAAVHLLRGDEEQALAWLDRAYSRGYRLAPSLALDPMFASLRRNPRFEAIVSRMEEAQARERARVEREGIAAVVDSMIAAGS